MSMSKKDYEAIARAIYFVRSVPEDYERMPGGISHDIALAIANHCAADNPRFDRASFLAACGVQS